MESNHCHDLEGDRALGAKWDKNFCRIAARFDKMFTAHQIGHKTSASAFYRCDGKWQRVILPDITIWSQPGEHHEIKHKIPTGSRCYGLEHYRFASLVHFARETDQQVYYTIHNWARCGRNSIENDPHDWFTCEVRELAVASKNGTAWNTISPSWVGGRKTEVLTWYWPIDLWVPLTSIWPVVDHARVRFDDIWKEPYYNEDGTVRR